ncbi:MAG TPA: SDR family NAD(P)-dependent oxidoreductase [Dehalococcoidales bacterium]|nr:SDR family NAD(P)-dependent oxidoreductase [Dehalococcoidales bacterium]
MLLKDRVAIVTGGAKGMGRGIAYRLAEEGCAVVVVDIDMPEAAVTVSEIQKRGGTALAIQCDVTRDLQVKAVVDQVVGRFSKIDILVNNAGGAHIKASIENLTEEQWDKVMNLNLKSVFFFCKYVVPTMKARKYGKIVSISSIGAVQPPGHVIAYNTAKSAIIGFSCDLATALAPLGINVNTILPGPVQTHFYDETVKGMTAQQQADFFAMLGRKVPLQRIGQPEDIGNAVVFLVSDMGSFITGHPLYVTGGLPLMPPSSPPPAK